jgi:preprotein translocase subunit SecE
MKKSDQKSKKREAREKSGSASTARPESGSGRASPREPKEERVRGNQGVPKKETEKRKEEKVSILRHIRVAGQFLRESRIELRKVKWPTRKELLASTAAVIVLVLVVALYLGLIDFGLIKVIRGIVG